MKSLNWSCLKLTSPAPKQLLLSNNTKMISSKPSWNWQSKITIITTITKITICLQTFILSESQNRNIWYSRIYSIHLHIICTSVIFSFFLLMVILVIMVIWLFLWELYGKVLCHVDYWIDCMVIVWLLYGYNCVQIHK